MIKNAQRKSPGGNQGSGTQIEVSEAQGLTTCWALRYAAHGLSVVPLHYPVNGRCSCKVGAACKSPGKHPRSSAWPRLATTDSNTIRAWWRAHPRANLGLTLGGLLVIDVDPRHAGDDSLAYLRAALGVLPDTWVTLTGGGGEHYYFTLPSTFEIGAKTNLETYPGIDFKSGPASMVVAPPSFHASGRRYEREASSPRHIAPCPQALIDLVTAPQPGRNIRAAPQRASQGDSVVHRATMRVALHLAGVPEPNRAGFTKCVFHDDANPSLHIVGPTGSETGFRCFACGAKGGILDFLVATKTANDAAHAARILEEALEEADLLFEHARKLGLIVEGGTHAAREP